MLAFKPCIFESMIRTYHMPPFICTCTLQALSHCIEESSCDLFVKPQVAG